MKEKEIHNQIIDLQAEITEKVDKYVSLNDNVSVLDEVKEKMGNMIEQGRFWIEQQNPERFVYDLRQFLIWFENFRRDNPHDGTS
tara:strand:+ start:274 stop:528 length:255 start_codon:yes stop_codon:yes gene_type:complete